MKAPRATTNYGAGKKKATELQRPKPCACDPVLPNKPRAGRPRVLAGNLRRNEAAGQQQQLPSPRKESWSDMNSFPTIKDEEEGKMVGVDEGIPLVPDDNAAEAAGKQRHLKPQQCLQLLQELSFSPVKGGEMDDTPGSTPSSSRSSSPTPKDPVTGVPWSRVVATAGVIASLEGYVHSPWSSVGVGLNSFGIYKTNQSICELKEATLKNGNLIKEVKETMVTPEALAEALDANKKEILAAIAAAKNSPNNN